MGLGKQIPAVLINCGFSSNFEQPRQRGKQTMGSTITAFMVVMGFVAPGGDHTDPLAQKALLGYKMRFGSLLLDEAEVVHLARAPCLGIEGRGPVLLAKKNPRLVRPGAGEARRGLGGFLHAFGFSQRD